MKRAMRKAFHTQENDYSVSSIWQLKNKQAQHPVSSGIWEEGRITDELIELHELLCRMQKKVH